MMRPRGPGWLVACAVGVVGLTGISGCAATPRPRSQAAARSTQYHRLVGIVSGDTLVVDMPNWNSAGSRQVNVRLIGIDAPPVDPERNKFSGERAADTVRDLVNGEWIRLEFNNSENRPLLHYDGTLVVDQECYVFLPPPATDPAGHEVFLNEWLLDEGLARRGSGVAQDDRGLLGKYTRRLDAAEQRARDTRRGLWSLPD